MTPLHFRSATAIAAAIRSGEITARAALEHFLERVDQHNGPLNAVIYQDREGARARADSADAARARGEELGPLHGVPMTIKECYQLAGSPTTWGIPQMKDNVTQRTAVAISRLQAAGANIFGKTNVPLGLGDLQSYNEIYGTTNNPWDLTRTPGGSSGGSAAALAAGLTSLEMGSDIGGSIRNPAHFCGVFGHKGTWNLVPQRGHSLDDSVSPFDINVVGPLARSADDLELAMMLVAGDDEADWRGCSDQLPALDGPLSDLTIGIWASDPICPTSSAVGARLQAVADALGRAGAKIDERSRPDFSSAHSHDTFGGLVSSAIAALLLDEDFQRAQARLATLSPDDHSPLAQQIRWQTMTLRDWSRLNEARNKIRWAWHRYFGEVDFLITPVMPVTAFPHDHGRQGSRVIDIDGQSWPYFSQTFWAGLAGVAYLPATVFPAGLATDGLPVGLQIIGPAYSDLRTIGLAQRLEAMGFGFTPPPAYSTWIAEVIGGGGQLLLIAPDRNLLEAAVRVANSTDAGFGPDFPIAA